MGFPIKNVFIRVTGEIAQWLRVLIAFAEDWLKFLAATWWFRTTSNPGFRGSDTIF